jgi:hypothetical protein
MTASDLLRFMRTQRLAVEASRAADGGVQTAVVGIAVTDAFERVFDTLGSTRKAQNLRNSPRAAFVLGGYSLPISAFGRLDTIQRLPLCAASNHRIHGRPARRALCLTNDG